MNLTGLTRHYDLLTAWERLPLILAALNRDDAAEEKRLSDSAPTKTAGVPHHFGLWAGLTDLAVAHQMQQLERVGYLLGGGLFLAIAKGKATAKGKTIDEEEEPAPRVRLLAFRLVVAADAWKLLCDELQVAPDAILRHMPGGKLVRDMEEAARKMAFSPEEALAYLRAQEEADEAAAGKAPSARRVYRFDTAADEARRMREFLEGRAARWL
jgi:hypothetical protein